MGGACCLLNDRELGEKKIYREGGYIKEKDRIGRSEYRPSGPPWWPHEKFY